MGGAVPNALRPDNRNACVWSQMRWADETQRLNMTASMAWNMRP